MPTKSKRLEADLNYRGYFFFYRNKQVKKHRHFQLIYQDILSESQELKEEVIQKSIPLQY